MSTPTVASLAREVAGLREDVAALTAVLERQMRIGAIMASAGRQPSFSQPARLKSGRFLPDTPRRDRHGMRAVEGGRR